MRKTVFVIYEQQTHPRAFVVRCLDSNGMVQLKAICSSIGTYTVFAQSILSLHVHLFKSVSPCRNCATQILFLCVDLFV